MVFRLAVKGKLYLNRHRDERKGPLLSALRVPQGRVYEVSRRRYPEVNRGWHFRCLTAEI
jgi:hypothetical protein